MALATTNVAVTTDTFENWLDKTNTLLYAYSTTIVTAAANSTGGVTTGNATVNGIFTANSLTVSGNSTFGLRGGNVVTANVLYITSNVSIGNATVNTVFTTTTIDTDLALTVLGATTLSNSLSVTGNTTLTGNATLSGTLQTIAGNVNIDTGTLFVDATNNRVGINNSAPGVALRVTGDADISATANIQGNANVGGIFGVVGNTTLNGALQTIAGNVNIDAGTLFVDATNNRVGINNTAPGVALRVTGAADISLAANIQGNANVGGTLGVVGAATITGTSTLTGNVTMSGALQTISGNVNIDTGTLFVDGTNNRVGVNNTTPGVALEVTGAANVSTSVNSALLTVGTSFIANTTGAYHTGLVNAASYNTTGFVANTTAIAPTSNTILLGNSIGRFVLSANTVDASGLITGGAGATITGQVNASTGFGSGTINATSNGLFANATTLSLGNSSVNVAIATSGITSSGGTGVNPSSNTVGTALGTSTQRWVLNANTIDTSGLITGGAGATVTGQVNASTGFGSGTINATSNGLFANSTTISLGNSSVNVAITTAGITSAGGTGVNPSSNLVGTILGTSTQRWVLNANSASFSGAVSGITTLATGNTTITGFANVSSTIQGGSSLVIAGAASGITTLAAGNTEITGFVNASASVSVSTIFIANTTGAYHAGLINAASHTTSGFVANTTAIAPTSNTILLGNSIGRFVLSANTGNFSGLITGSAGATITGQVNASTGFGSGTINATSNGFFANDATVSLGNSSVNVAITPSTIELGTQFDANSLGLYHTGVVNAASHSTSGFVANTTVIAPTSNTLLLGNTIGRWVISANTGDFSGSMVIGGAANVGSTLNVVGSANVGGSLNVVGAANVGSALSVVGNVTINTFATILTLANNNLGANITVPVTAVSFPKANFRAGELILYVVKGSEYQISKILFAHDDNDVNQTIYGTLMAPSSSSELANNIVLTVSTANTSNIDINMRQRAINSSVKIVANMIS